MQGKNSLRSELCGRRPKVSFFASCSNTVHPKAVYCHSVRVYVSLKTGSGESKCSEQLGDSFWESSYTAKDGSWYQSFPSLSKKKPHFASVSVRKAICLSFFRVHSQLLLWFWMTSVGYATPIPAGITIYGKRRRQRGPPSSQWGNSDLSPHSCCLSAGPGLHLLAWQQTGSETQKLLWTLFQHTYILCWGFFLIFFFCSCHFQYVTSAIISRAKESDGSVSKEDRAQPASPLASGTVVQSSS